VFEPVPISKQGTFCYCNSLDIFLSKQNKKLEHILMPLQNKCKSKIQQQILNSKIQQQILNKSK